MTGWAMLGLEAAGRNPLDVGRGGETPVDYLRVEAGRLRSAGDLERTILALEAAGRRPAPLRRRRPGRRAAPAPRRRRLGRRPGQPDRLLRARAARRRRPSRARWSARRAGCDGPRTPTAAGGSSPPRRASRLDRRGAAGPDRCRGPAAERPATAPASCDRRSARAAAARSAASGVVNSQSTAWAVQGLVGDRLRRPARSTRRSDYLGRLRAADGHYRYSASSDQTPVWVTAQVLLAVERQPFPLPAAPPGRPARSATGSGGGGSGDSGGGAPSAAGDAGFEPGARRGQRRCGRRGGGRRRRLGRRRRRRGGRRRRRPGRRSGRDGLGRRRRGRRVGWSRVVGGRPGRRERRADGRRRSASPIRPTASDGDLPARRRGRRWRCRDRRRRCALVPPPRRG